MTALLQRIADFLLLLPWFLTPQAHHDRRVFDERSTFDSRVTQRNRLREKLLTLFSEERHQKPTASNRVVHSTLL